MNCFIILYFHIIFVLDKKRCEFQDGFFEGTTSCRLLPADIDAHDLECYPDDSSMLFMRSHLNEQDCAEDVWSNPIVDAIPTGVTFLPDCIVLELYSCWNCIAYYGFSKINQTIDYSNHDRSRGPKNRFEPCFENNKDFLIYYPVQTEGRSCIFTGIPFYHLIGI